MGSLSPLLSPPQMVTSKPAWLSVTMPVVTTSI
jgi:hypothetical protein